MNSEQAQLFEGWVQDVLEGGAVTFVIPFKTPAGLIDHTCKFISDYRAVYHPPNRWEFAVDVEIEKLELLDDGLTTSVIDIGAQLTDLEGFIIQVEENVNKQ